MDLPSHTWSFRTTILLSFVSITLVTGIGLGQLFFSYASASAHQQTDRILEDSIRRTEREVKGLLRRCVDQAILNTALIPSQELTIAHVREHSPFFLQLFELFPELSDLGVGWEQSGDYAIYTRPETGQLFYREYVCNPKGEREIRSHRVVGKEIQPVEILPWNGYDPRVRPFYRKAKEAQAGVWVSYPFLRDFGKRTVPGVTYALPVYDRFQQLVAVWTVDLDLWQLSDFLKSLQISQPGYVFLVEEKPDGSHALMAHPDLSMLSGARLQQDYRTADTIGDPIAAEFLRSLPKSFETIQPSKTKSVFQTADGSEQIVHVQPLLSDLFPRWLIVYVIPKAFLWTPIYEQQKLYTLFLIFLLGIAVVVAIYLSQRLAQPIYYLATQTQQLERADSYQSIIEQGSREVRNLTRSINQMFHNLQAHRQELIRSNQSLQSLQERFANAFYISPVAMSIFRREGAIVLDVNETWLSITALKKEDVIGQSLYALGFKNLSPGDNYLSQQLSEQGCIRNIPSTLQLSDGRVRDVIISGVALTLDGEACSLWTYQDITELRAAQKQVQQMNVELEHRVQQRTAELAATNKELEAFSYSVSHDLRTPLRSIDGFSKALLEDYAAVLDEEGKSYLQRVRKASQRMGELIDDLLHLSRVGRMELHFGIVDLTAMCHRIADHFQQIHPERQIIWCIASGIEVIGDSKLLQIALDNLLSNAWKYSSKKPDARIEFGEQHQGSERVFFVRDNGAGFDPQFAHKLFQPFTRLHRAEEFEGHGIGLATVQRILHRHDGRIWAESQPGQGATFYFTIGMESTMMI